MTEHSSSHIKTHVVKCPVCSTRMSVRTMDVGRKTECPDCHHRFTIEKAEIKLEVPDPIVLEDGYGLKEVAHDHDDARKKMGQEIMSQAQREIKEQAERKDLNKRTQGAFEERKPRNYQESEEEEKKHREQLTPIDYDPREELVDYPLTFSPKEIQRDILLFSDVGLLMRWVFLSLFASVTVYFAANAIYYGLQPNQTFMTYMYSLAGSALSVVLGAGTIIFLGSHFLFLVMSISSGQEEWDWPELGIFDRMMEALFLVIAALLSFVPFGIMATIDPWSALPLLAFTFLAFPVIYLSMLDQGSVVTPWSGMIVSSLFKLPGKWLLFYVATSVLISAILAAGAALFFFAGIDRLAYIALPGGVMLVGGTFVYSLWLGRLSWEIGALSAAQREEEE
ncbi:hypothetical protein Pan97_17990 [Bremerella volcania]|uniref:Uncharacterized protein n=1 Tax=Bremerella volcania TaxID=2527984 RepID=A0A518C6D5_9BACT|nr:hypothetical protein [Bremerella volcania]QDU74783.1 hypothetical protein Pan97_17990 [Bremerella volcania]